MNLANLNKASAIPFVEAIVAFKANSQVKTIKSLAQQYYQDTSPCSDNCAKWNVRDAIMYASSKIKTRRNRNTALATANTALVATGTTIGSIAGSIVPLAGTAAGGLIGASSAGAATTSAYYILRAMKKTYKIIKGTQGVHRRRCAEILLSKAYCLIEYRHKEPDNLAAYHALRVLLPVIGIANKKQLAVASHHKVLDVIFQKDFKTVENALKST